MGERIAICTTQVPFLSGGAELQVSHLRQAFIEHGHQADVVTLPFKWYPARKDVIRSMLLWRLLDLSSSNGSPIDRVIAMKFPAFGVQHPNKIAWIIHQHREAYDLWDAGISAMRAWTDGQAAREMIVQADGEYLQESRKLFAESHTVARRLAKYNNLIAEPLYHPPPTASLLRPGPCGDFILCPSRLDPLKRQCLLFEALARTKTQVPCIVMGEGPSERELRALVVRLGLQHRVRFVGFVPTAEKIRLYTDALAIFFGPLDEDYGYITLEAFASAKAVITYTDSGGPLEFVRDKENGYIVPPDSPHDLVSILDELYTNKRMAAQLGETALGHYRKLDLSWHTVVERLLSC